MISLQADRYHRVLQGASGDGRFSRLQFDGALGKSSSHAFSGAHRAGDQS